MKFKSLKIEKFLAITEAEISLDSRGLILIQGDNQVDSSADSNGAGKSSIADALCWVLYGTTARNVSGDAVVNNLAGKGTKVELVVEDGSDTYLVTRYRKHKEGKNSLAVLKIDDSGIAPVRTDLTQGTDKLTQEVVNKIIGCSYEVFCASIYAGQENFPDIPGMTDKQLKLLVEEAAGTTVLDAAYDEARKRAAAVKVELADISRQIDHLVSSAAVASSDLKDNKECAAYWDKARNLRADQSLATAKTRAADAKKLIDEIGTKRKDYEAKIADCDAKLAAVKVEHDEEHRLVKILNIAERAEASAAATEANTKAVVNNRKTAIENISHRIGCPCRECGKSYTEEDIEPAKIRALADLEEKENELASATERLESAQNDAKKARDALESHRASMTDVSETNDVRARYTSMLGDVANLERQRDLAIKDAKWNKDEVLRIKSEINPYDAQIEKLEKRLADITTQIDTLKAELKKQEKTLKIAEAVAEVFSPAGVRAHILDTVTPFLNAQTSKYLASLSDGNITATWTTLTKTAKGDYREKFAVEVVSATGGESFGSISGGEKRKVRIACAMALQDLVATRATKPIELFFGDEIDGALDAAGLERLMVVLEEKARERGTVLVVSHHNLKDYISQVITVIKTATGSTIEESLA